MKHYLKYILFFCNIQFIFMDIEYLNSLHNDMKMDVEALLKDSKRVNNVCTKDPESLWSYVEREIDLNRDGKIDMSEFRDTVTKQVRKSQRKEINDLITKLDPKNTGSITFERYINDALGETYDLKTLSKDDNSINKNDELYDIKIFYQSEKDRWYHISSGKDELNHEQFGSFIYSDDYPEIKDFEFELHFKTLDEDKNGYLSFEEYVMSMKYYDESIVDIKRKKLLSNADLNGDNLLDLNEYKTWLNKTFREHLYQEESQYVFDPCDTDKDDNLNKTEVLKCCDTMMKSHLTDFGDDFLPPHQVKDEL